MKTLINIIAHVYDENGKITHAERSFSFIRPRSAKKPTYIGAARMVAKDLGCAPSDVAVTRIEVMCYATA
jgi:hypothetical protein